MLKYHMELSDKRDDARDEAHQVYSMAIITINMLDKIANPTPAVGATMDAQIAHLISARRRLGDAVQELAGFIGYRERMK